MMILKIVFWTVLTITVLFAMAVARKVRMMRKEKSMNAGQIEVVEPHELKVVHSRSGMLSVKKRYSKVPGNKVSPTSSEDADLEKHWSLIKQRELILEWNLILKGNSTLDKAEKKKVTDTVRLLMRKGIIKVNQ